MKQDPARIERALRATSIALGFVAAAWVLASRELSDFLGEGPVRVLDLDDGSQQTLIGVGTLVLVAIAAAVTWARLPLWRYAAGGLALLACVALAPPLFVPIGGLYTLAFGAAVLARTPRDRLDALAPRRHPAAWAGGGVVALAAFVVVAWVSVWLLRPLFDEGTHLDEALAFEVPAVTEVTGTPPPRDLTTTTPASAAVSATGARTGTVLAMGQLQGADSFHFGSGTVRLLRSPEGELVLRFEGYEVRNGPDLFVYLTTDPSGNVGADGALDLGAIKATSGNVNYALPAGTDTSSFRSAVIWCRSFDVVFAVATFE